VRGHATHDGRDELPFFVPFPSFPYVFIPHVQIFLSVVMQAQWSHPIDIDSTRKGSVGALSEWCAIITGVRRGTNGAVFPQGTCEWMLQPHMNSALFAWIMAHVYDPE